MSSTPVEYLPSSNLKPCRRCQQERAALVSRKEEFCAKCFIWFMRGKQRKQMIDERYKVKYGKVAERLGTQRALLPLSFGVSSLVLFDMIASLLKEQNLAHKGKQGFELVVVHLKENGVSRKESFEILASKYAPVCIKFLEVDLDSDLDLDSDSDSDSFPVSTRMKLTVSPEFDVFGSTQVDSSETVSELLQNCATRSSKEDLRGLLYEEIFNKIALQEQCQTLLYGHSMTRLANEVLALTVMGRGSKIHQAVADRTMIYKGSEIHVIFPLKEILFAEVKAVLHFSEGLSEFLVNTGDSGPKLVKNMTVHDLTTQYFDNLDATGYASTASTVVKTAEKLGEPPTVAQSVCRICGSRIHHDPRTWLRNITVNQAAPLETDAERSYANAYSAQTPHLSSGSDITVCYGCTVTMAGAGAGAGDGFVWPVRATKEEILDEYTLSDASGEE